MTNRGYFEFYTNITMVLMHQLAEAGVATDRNNHRNEARQHGHEEDGVSKVASSADMDRKGVSVTFD